MSQKQKSKRELLWEQRKQAREARSHEPSSKGSQIPAASENQKLPRGKDKNETNNSTKPVPQTKNNPPANSNLNKNQSQGPLTNDDRSIAEESIHREERGRKIPTEASSHSPYKAKSLERSPPKSGERNGSKSRILENSPSQNQPLTAVDLDLRAERDEEKKKKHDYAEFLRHQMIEKYHQKLKLRSEDRDIPTKIGQRDDEERAAMFEKRRKQQYGDFLRLQMEEKAAKQKRAMHESMEEARRDVSPPFVAKEHSFTPKKAKYARPAEPEIIEDDNDDSQNITEQSSKNLLPHPPSNDRSYQERPERPERSHHERQHYEKPQKEKYYSERHYPEKPYPEKHQEKHYPEKVVSSRKEPEKPIINKRNIFQEPPLTPENARKSFHQRKYKGRSVNQSLVHQDDDNEGSYENLPTKERMGRRVEIAASPPIERELSGETNGALSGRSRKGEKMATDGTRGFLLDSEHPMIVAAKEKVKKDYQREIKEQIAEKRRKKEAEARKKIHEEQMEELRVQREQEELALKYMREKEHEIVRNKLGSGDKADKIDYDEFPTNSRNNLNDPKQPDAPKIVIRNGRKMILTPEQEAMEKMQKELAEKEEAMRQMQLEAEKARAQAQPKETPKVSNPSQRLLPNVNPEGQSAGHMVYNGANYIVPQPFVMQFPTSQVANPDNEALKKEIQELKAEVNKYNEQLAVQIHEAKKEVHMAVEERNRAEIELNRLREEMRLKSSIQKQDEITTIEAMDPNVIKNHLINSLNSNDDSIPQTNSIQSQDLRHSPHFNHNTKNVPQVQTYHNPTVVNNPSVMNPHYLKMPDQKKDHIIEKSNYRISEEHEHTHNSSKRYLNTGGSEASLPTNPNTGSNIHVNPYTNQSKKQLHENPSNSDITVSLMHQTKLVPFGGIDHLSFDPNEPRPKINLKEKSNQYDASQLIPEHYDDSPVGIDFDRKKVPVQNQRGSLEYPGNSIAVTESLGMKLYQPTQSNDRVELQKAIQAQNKPTYNQKAETENKLKEIVNYQSARTKNVSPMAPPSKLITMPFSDNTQHENKTKTPKKIDTEMDVWPRTNQTDQSANHTPKTDKDNHPVPSNIGRDLYPVTEDPHAELQTTMLIHPTVTFKNNTSHLDQPPTRKENNSNLNRSMEYHIRDTNRPLASKSDIEARSNSISSTHQNPAHQPVQTHPKMHPHTTKEVPINNYINNTQSSASAKSQNDVRDRSIRQGQQGPPSQRSEPTKTDSRTTHNGYNSADERRAPPKIETKQYHNADGSLRNPGIFTPQDPIIKTAPFMSNPIMEQKFPVFEHKTRTNNTQDTQPRSHHGTYDNSSANPHVGSGVIKELPTVVSKDNLSPITLLQNKKIGYESEVDRDKSPNRWSTTPKPGKNHDTFSNAGMQILQTTDTHRENVLEKEAQKLKQIQLKKDPYEDYPQIRASMEARNIHVENHPAPVRDIFATIQDGKPKKQNVFGHKYNPIPFTSSKDLLALQRSQLSSADSNFNARDIQMRNDLRLERLEKYGILGLDDSKEDIFEVKRKHFEMQQAMQAQQSNPNPQRFLMRDQSKSPIRKVQEEEEDEITRLDNLLRKHIRESKNSK